MLHIDVIIIYWILVRLYSRIVYWRWIVFDLANRYIAKEIQLTKQQVKDWYDNDNDNNQCVNDKVRRIEWLVLITTATSSYSCSYSSCSQKLERYVRLADRSIISRGEIMPGSSIRMSEGGMENELPFSIYGSGKSRTSITWSLASLNHQVSEFVMSLAQNRIELVLIYPSMNDKEQCSRAPSQCDPNITISYQSS